MSLKWPTALCSLLVVVVLLAASLPFGMGQFCCSPCSILNLELSFPTPVEAGQSFTVSSTGTVSCYGLLLKVRADLVDASSNVILATTSLLPNYSTTGSYMVTLTDHAVARSFPGNWALVLRAYIIERVSGFSVGSWSQLFQVTVIPYTAEVTQATETTVSPPIHTPFRISQLMLATMSHKGSTGDAQPATSNEGLLALVPSSSAQLTSTSNPTIGVCYSPGYLASDCVGIIVYWIGRANSSVHVFTYSLTSPNITQALAEAAARHVNVKVALGMLQAGSKYSQYGNLLRSGVNVRLSGIPDQVRDQVYIIDGHIVLWESLGADEINYFNDQKFLVFDSTTLAAAYEQEFQSSWNASV